ncbi:MAG TPA: hypothetical protein ENJ95_12680 [Bacteroidetes bacterium]|nr:hypothetical protein [Bacteroidota bacterium]
MKNLLLLAFLFFAGSQLPAQNDLPDCNDAPAIKKYLEENGFESTPTTILRATGKTDAKGISDYAQLLIREDGMKINMAQAMQKDIANGASEGFNVVAIITKNENFCDEDVQKIIANDFDKGKYDASYNIHIWDNPNSNEDLLFERVNTLVFDK